MYVVIASFRTLIVRRSSWFVCRAGALHYLPVDDCRMSYAEAQAAADLMLRRVPGVEVSIKESP